MKNKVILTAKQTESKERRILPAVVLFFLTPLFGEYLLGILPLSEVPYALFLAPMYGGGALLIREVTRRAGRGTATMLILGIAYGLIEEGIIDQMLFNPNYLGGRAGQDWNTYIPFLGIDGRLTIYVLAMHAIWSICIPILIVEVLFSESGTKPWLNKKGLGLVSAIFILGSAFLYYDTTMENQFFASIPQLIGTMIAIILLVIVSFKFGRHIIVPTTAFVPKPFLVGLVSLVASSLFMLADSRYGWYSFAACVLLPITFFIIVYHWSRSNGWGDRYRLAIAVGATLTYAWLGLFSGSVIFGCGAIVLLILANRKLKNMKYP